MAVLTLHEAQPLSLNNSSMYGFASRRSSTIPSLHSCLMHVHLWILKSHVLGVHQVACQLLDSSHCSHGGLGHVGRQNSNWMLYVTTSHRCKSPRQTGKVWHPLHWGTDLLQLLQDHRSANIHDVEQYDHVGHTPWAIQPVWECTLNSGKHQCRSRWTAALSSNRRYCHHHLVEEVLQFSITVPWAIPCRGCWWISWNPQSANHQCVLSKWDANRTLNWNYCLQWRLMLGNIIKNVCMWKDPPVLASSAR